MLNLFSKVSTKPHYESYTWGKHRSFFASTIFWLIFVLRIFSPLQWVKLIFRRKQAAAHNDEKERVDFHAMHSEFYLLIVLSLSIAFYFFPPYSLSSFFDIPKTASSLLTLAVDAILILLLIESVMWVLYYMLLRILIEKHLTIFNEAEYFVALPFVLATQFFLLAELLGVSVSEVIALAMNLEFINYKSTQITQLTIGIFGYIYTALIIANIINLIPAIPVGRRPNITIIGAGDVVQHRMLPALLDQKLYLPSQIAIISDHISSEFFDQLKVNGVTFERLKTCSNSEEKVQNVIKFIKKRSSYAIIATPTESHFTYISALAKEGIIFGVEKPLVATDAELAIFRQCQEQLMEQGFLFSYYWLEKALPLNYFLTLNPQYRRFLEIEVIGNEDDNQSKRQLGPDSLAYLRLQLGKLVGVDITFFEGSDSREWALLKEKGGFFFETLIHPITLLKNALDTPLNFAALEAQWYVLKSLPDAFENEKYELRDFGASYVSLCSVPGTNCDIRIRAGKFMSTKRRSMNLIFENGTLDMDLDSRVCEIICDDAGSMSNTSISVHSSSGAPKYDVQMSLFNSFIQNQGCWSAQRYDDYPSQVDVLSAMTDWLKVNSGPSHFYKPEILDDENYKKLG